MINKNNYTFTLLAKTKVSLYGVDIKEVVSELLQSVSIKDTKVKLHTSTYNNLEYRTSLKYKFYVSIEYIDDKKFYRVINFYPLYATTSVR